MPVEMPEKITVWKDATEPFGGWHETQAGQGAAGDERFYIRADIMREARWALEWALAEIYGRTNYTDPQQRANAHARALAALATLTKEPGDG